MSEPIRPPSPLLQFMERRLPLEAAALAVQLPMLRFTSPRGDGSPVLVLPGFFADDTSTLMLRRFLDGIGYTAYGWGRGLNRGAMLSHLAPTLALAAEISEKHKRPLQIVGWSRGGILARELGRERPDLIRQIITLGSPVQGGSGASSIGSWVRQETGLSQADIARMLRERESRGPIDVPIVAIYSKTDGVVAWRACIDEHNANVEHVTVDSSHGGLGFNAEVYRLVANRLARTPGTDQPG